MTSSSDVCVQTGDTEDEFGRVALVAAVGAAQA